MKIDSIFSRSWDIFKKDWGKFVIVSIILIVLAAPPIIGPLLRIFMLFLMINAILKAIRGNTLTFASFFEFKNTFNKNTIMVAIIYFLFEILALIIRALIKNMEKIKDFPMLLVIVLTLCIGVILFYLTLVFFPIFCVAVDKKTLSFKEMFCLSAKLTKGARTDVFVFLILGGVIFMVGSLLLLVGIFVAIPIVCIATVLFYLELDKQKAKTFFG